jgi:hypothetical protein
MPSDTLHITSCPYPWSFASGTCGQCGLPKEQHVGHELFGAVDPVDLMRADTDGMIDRREDVPFEDRLFAFGVALMRGAFETPER